MNYEGGEPGPIGPAFPVLDRYLLGESKPSDENVLWEWAAAHPGDGEVLVRLHAFVRETSAPVASGDALWAAMQRRMVGAHVSPMRRPARWWRTGSAIGALTMAAAVLLIVLFPDVRGRPGRTETANVAEHHEAETVAANVPSVAVTAPVVRPNAPVDSDVQQRDSEPSVARRHPSRVMLARAQRARRAESDAGLARSPDDVAPPGGAVSIADDAPGAADTHWP